MKTAWASVITATAASICCIGPVVAVLAGAGGIAAAALRFEPWRPVFLVVTFVLLGLGFYGAYRPDAATCSPGSACPPSSKRRAKWTIWTAASIVLLFIMFPYYIGWLL